MHSASTPVGAELQRQLQARAAPVLPCPGCALFHRRRRPIDHASWQRLEHLFDEALELPAGRRAAFCDRACTGDPELRSELLSLLEAHGTDGLLDRPLATPSLRTRHEPLPAGMRIGAWRLGELIQRGGAGEVYFATRADGAFEQQVALKLLHRESAPDIDRFQAERQILASLEHPGIARLLDGGLTESGALYAVVEYVDGDPITLHCDSVSADLPARLALFDQVCEAVAYAHRHLIVHRDLKPANILVSREGRVKLLDFGVAKRLDTDAPADDAALTRAPYTSDYAAPEQLTGAAVTTATDVYALGVLLFELLAGQRPWRSDALPIARIVQLIVHEEPPPASRMAIGAVSARRLEGDLDAIVATCLRKDPTQRYAGVDALRRDLAHHLAHKPVEARGRARRYLVHCALRRHRWVALGATAFVLALATGLGTTAWQMRRAELERDVARRAALQEEAVRLHLTNLFRAGVTPGDPAPPTAKALLDSSATRVLKEYAADPILAGKVVVALTELYGALGDIESQVSLLEGFISTAGSQADPAVLATVRSKLAEVELLRGNLRHAEELLSLAEAFWARAPGEFLEQRLGVLLQRGRLLRLRNDLDGSIRVHRQAVGERIAFSGVLHTETATLYNSLALTLGAANRLDESLAAFRTALSIDERLGKGEELPALIKLGNIGGVLLRMGRLREAEPILKEAYRKQQARGGDSAPVAASMSLYGSALTTAGRAAEAVEILRTASAMGLRYTGPASPLTIQVNALLAEALMAQGEFASARDVARRNHAAALDRLGAQSPLVLWVRAGQARVLLLEGHATAAEAEFVSLVAALRAVGQAGRPMLALALLGQGEALLAQSQPAAAVGPLREALALRTALLWPEAWELAQVRVRLGEALHDSGSADGRAAMEQGLVALSAALGEQHPEVLRGRRALGARK